MALVQMRLDRAHSSLDADRGIDGCECGVFGNRIVRERQALGLDSLRERRQEHPDGHVAIGAAMHADLVVGDDDLAARVQMCGEGTEGEVGVHDADAQQEIDILHSTHDDIGADRAHVKTQAEFVALGEDAAAE